MVDVSQALQTIGGAVAPFNPAAGGILAGAGTVIGLISGQTSSVSGITAAQQAALSGGFGGPVTSTGTSVGPTIGVGTAGGVANANLGGVVPPIIRQLPRIIGAVGAGAAGQAIVQGGSSMMLGPTPSPRTMTQKQFILATARAFQPGATAKKIIRSARQCGIELAAATFGLDVLQVCFLISQPPTRRSRGISAADIRRTRSTMRKINSLKNMCPPARRRK